MVLSLLQELSQTSGISNFLQACSFQPLLTGSVRSVITKNLLVMNKPITYYHVVLDRSGSMASCWRSAMNALQNQYEQIQNTKAKYPDQEMMYSWCFFNDEIHMSEAIETVTSNLHLPESIRPDGLTALHDAVGLSIEYLQKQVGTNVESNDKADVVLMIITDGEENASRFFTGPGIERLIKTLEATEKWTFLFVGLDLEMGRLIKDYQLKPSSTIRFSKSGFAEDYKRCSIDLTESFAEGKGDKSKKKFRFGL